MGFTQSGESRQGDVLAGCRWLYGSRGCLLGGVQGGWLEETQSNLLHSYFSGI